MDQTAPSPTPPSGRLPRISRSEPGPSACPRNGLRSVGPRCSCPNRNGESLLAVPEGGALQASKAGVLAELRHRITAIERGPSLIATSSSALAAQHQCLWTLGAAEVDERLSRGLDAASLHEVKAEPQIAGLAAGGWAAALGFALRLAVRRLQSIETSAASPPRILWCWPSVFAREIGAPYGHGFVDLGLRACGVAVRRDAASRRCVVGHGGRSALAEPGSRRRRCERSRADGGPPPQPRRGGASDAVPAHHRSASLSGRVDGDALARRRAGKRGPSLRRRRSRGAPLRRHVGTLPAPPADARAGASLIGMVG